MRITIGLLVFNHEKYISDAIQGLMNQKGNSIQLIILDDASTDKSVKYINDNKMKLESHFSEVLYIFREENSGNISRNCNEIIKDAKGELIWIIAGDDIMMEGAVECLEKVFERVPESTVAYGNVIRVDDNYKYGDSYSINNKLVMDQSEGIQNNLFRRLMMKNEIPAPAVIMKRHLFEQYGLHDENIPFEDYEYWVRLSRTEKFYFEDVPVVLYRESENSLSNSKTGNYHQKLWKRIMVNYAVLEKYEHYLNATERSTIWKEFFNYSFLLCNEAGYDEGLDLLKEKQRIKGVIGLDSRQTDYKIICDRLNKEGDLFVQWMIKDANAIYKTLFQNNIETVAIYGFSRLGIVLKDYLERHGTDVKYIIDQKGDMIHTDKRVYTLNDSLELVDAVIITPIGLYDEIKQKLENKLKCKYFNIEDLILG